jgi:hypothetical protein
MIVACDAGNKDSSKYVVGSVWASRKGAFFEFEKQSLELRLRHKCWGKLQWKKNKSSDQIIAMYLEFTQLFINLDINFSCIVVDKMLLRKYPHLGTNIDQALPSIIYLLVTRAKRYFNTKINLHILLDNEQLGARGEIIGLKASINKYMLNDKERRGLISLEHLQECDSHICSLLQICDILTGSVSGAVNGSITNKNLAISQELENSLSLSLQFPTIPSYKKFNIWFWKPSIPFTTQ